MRIVLMIILMALPIGARAQERLVRLYVPEALIETGLMRHILPRFTLKTQIRVELLPTGQDADMVWGTGGRALFQQGETTWGMTLQGEVTDSTKRFGKWLSGDIGQRTIMGFAPNGTPLFAPPTKVTQVIEAVTFDGDPKQGHRTAKLQCGRCHAVDEAGRMTDISSTPSFFVLRSLEDWDYRFNAFYTLRPHGSFTQIKEVTEPFALNAPPAIKPIEITLDDLDDITAYAATLEPADLGAPLVHQ